MAGGGNLETYIFDRDVAWIKEADLVVAEVSMPSVGVGYEIGFAESLGKKIICL
ncbi:MAG: nucleoside 2-deoxyribosyltransferase [archaeon]